MDNDITESTWGPVAKWAELSWLQQSEFQFSCCLFSSHQDWPSLMECASFCLSISILFSTSYIPDNNISKQCMTQSWSIFSVLYISVCMPNQSVPIILNEWLIFLQTYYTILNAYMPLIFWWKIQWVYADLYQVLSL